MLFGRRHRLRFVLVLPLLCGTVALAGLGPIETAAREPGARKAIAPLLQSSRPLRIGVVGDSVAGDLARGLHKLLRTRDTIEVIKFTKPATGLMRDDVYDWRGALEGFVRKHRLDVVTVMIGGNDRQSIWMNGRRLTFGSREWQEEYERRVARFTRGERAHDTASQPPVVPRRDARSRSRIVEDTSGATLLEDR